MKYCPKCQQQFDDAQSFCPTDDRLLSLPDPYHLVGRTLIEKYRIDALVGIGGMGAVYSAHHLTINRRVAFKILLPNLALGNEKMLSLFQREAETAGQLSHENIVDVKDAGRTPEGLAYIVMEWLEGRTLEEELWEKERLGFARIAQIVRQIAAALDYAHARLIVHRDLKPSNIMLAPRGNGSEQVKVLDFGIAKVINDNAASPVSRIMGTPHYSSPEQLRIGADIDGRSDIYSLGVILFQMLTGRLPFEAETAQEMVWLHRNEPPPPVRGFRPETPVAIEQLIERMMAKEPQLRPRTATEAADVFDRAISLPDQSKTPHETRIVTSNIAPPITSGKTGGKTSRKTSGGRESEQTEMVFAPTQVERPTAISERTTMLAAPETAPHIQPKEPKEPEKLKEPKGSRPGLKKLGAAVAVALLLFFAVLLIRDLINRIGRSGSARELMAYQLEILSADGKSVRRASGEAPLVKRETFKLHFTSQRRGYIYIIAPDAENNPATFLTAQPNPAAGVTSNIVEAGADFVFPAHHDQWLGISEYESRMDFTLIFSETPMDAPAFLAAAAGHKLTGAEQSELTRLRRQFGVGQTEVSTTPGAQVSRIMLKRPDAIASHPVVAELTVKFQ